MKIQTMDAPKRAQIYWLNHSEAQDEAISAFLQNDFSLQKEQKILSVVIESGNGELEEQLYLLMKRQTAPGRAKLDKAS